MAGDVASGNGGLTTWRGEGELTRGEILEILAAAELPSSWAPSPKSDRAHLGASVRSLHTGALITRCAPAAAWRRSSDDSRVREYRVRHVVARNRAASSEVGESLGDVVLTVELRDDSHDLVFGTDGSPEAERCQNLIQSEYDAATASERFKAGDVTTWLRWVLVRHVGAAQFAGIHYIPCQGMGIANRLLGALSVRWGASWMYPMIPVANSEQLAAGISAGFAAEIDAVARDLEAARNAVRARTKLETSEVSARTAARLMGVLEDLDHRAHGYRVLCGDQLISACANKLRALIAEIRPLVDDATHRFLLLELDDLTTTEEPATPSPSERAAERAYQERVAAHQQAVEHRQSVEDNPPRDVPTVDQSVEERRRRNAAAIAEQRLVTEQILRARRAEIMTPEAIEPPPEIADPTSARFSLLELD